MPIYEYQCAACGKIVEKWQNFSESPLTVCPQCGGSLTKIISSCAFHLKGSGWYASEYAGKTQDGDNSSKTQETPGAQDTQEVKDAPAAKEAKEGDKSDSTPPPKFKGKTC